MLIGENVLGRLLVELRQELVSGLYALMTAVDPLPIQDFLLFGQAIPGVNGSERRTRS